MASPLTDLPKRSKGLGVILGCILMVVGCNDSQSKTGEKLKGESASESAKMTDLPPPKEDSADSVKGYEPQVRAFCGDCHAMPLPSSFAKDSWFSEIERGVDFYVASGRSDLAVPKTTEVQKYFRVLAPKSLEIPAPLAVDASAVKRFAISNREGVGAKAAAVSFIEQVRFTGIEGEVVLVSDMRGGEILLSQQSGNEFGLVSRIDGFKNPAHIEVVDLDRDGLEDLVVADLGSFLPADHDRGALYWLRRKEKATLEFEKQEILSKRGRIADVRGGDIDSDGDVDLLVADFGWHTTGAILWLENTTPKRDEAGSENDPITVSFQSHEIDPRPGTIHLPMIDLNADGKLDFIALISQEFERIEAFINLGDGTFRNEKIFDAEDPAFGSSGIQLVDFDGDQDIDIVYSNGDTFDSFFVKPYHAVHWLENLGDLQFKHHRVATMPGVHRALASDLDSDGDMDIVASAFLPARLTSTPASSALESLVWIEQVAKGEFRKRPLETGRCIHPAILVDDLNGDGKPDIAAGNFWENETDTGPLLDLWMQQ